MNPLKRPVQALAAAIALSCSLPLAASPADSHSECRESRLKGLFVFSASGFNIVDGIARPKAIVETIDFNGDGTLTTPGLSLSNNGFIVRLAQGNPGTYTLAADCRGSVAFADGITFDFTADLAGGVLWMIQTNPNTVFQGSAKRLSR